MPIDVETLKTGFPALVRYEYSDPELKEVCELLAKNGFKSIDQVKETADRPMLEKCGILSAIVAILVPGLLCPLFTQLFSTPGRVP